MSAPVLSLAETRARLVPGAIVLWPYRDDVEEGTVLFVRGDQVDLVWLEGYKSRNDTVPVSEVLSVSDERAPEVALFPFRGRGWLTEAGRIWQQAHPRP